MQKLVGGLIEFTPKREDGSQFCVNEEGIVHGLPDNPFAIYGSNGVEGHYKGNAIHGRIDENGNFVGFDEPEKYLLKKVEISPLLFEKDKIFTVISVSDFMAKTTCAEVKATGLKTDDGMPIFKEAKKRGTRRMFTLRNLKEKDVLIFEGAYKDMPFVVDGDMTTNRAIRCNALINLHGNPDVIVEWVKERNINPYFTAFDIVNHISENGDEWLLFTDVPASCRLVQDKRMKQLERIHKAITA
jgi:hypothetical protein